MKPTWFLAVRAAMPVLAGLLLSGCGDTPPDGVQLDAPVEIGPKFSAKNGLLIPMDTRKSLGLTLVEVSEEPVASLIRVELRPFQRIQQGWVASAMVSAEEAARIRPGQAVLGGPDSALVMGRVRMLDEQLKLSTGLVEVVVDFSDSDLPVQTGGFLSAFIRVDDGKPVVSIPREAVIECSDGYSVYTTSGEHFVRTHVQVGGTNGSRVEILDGLYTGDQVVQRPVMSLWLTELAALKGGQSCCLVAPKPNAGGASASH